MGGLRARLGYTSSNILSDTDPAEARDYYQSVIDSVSSVIFTVDRELRITGVNRQWDAFAQAHGDEYLPSNRILGTPVLNLMKGALLERWRRVCQQLLDGEIPHYQDEVAREGKVAWRNYGLSTSPLKDSRGEIIGITFVVTNITQLKKAETEMLRRMVQIRGLRQLSYVAGAMFDWRSFHKQVTADIAHLFDAEKCVIFRWSESSGHLQAQVPAYGLGGFEQIELPLDIGDPDDPASLWQDLEEKDYILLNEGGDSPDDAVDAATRTSSRYAAMLAVLRVSGRVHGTILVAGRDRPFTDQDGHLLATFALPIVLTIEDAELNQRLRDRTRQLMGVREELERMTQIAESIRRPVTVVRGYLELLLDGVLGPVPEEQTETMNMLLDKTREIADVVGRLLPSKSLSETTRYESIHLADLVRTLLSKRNTSIRLAGLDLIAQLPAVDDHEYVTACDPDSLFNVFDALLDNAIKFSPNGGAIHISMHQSGEIIYIKIQDPGVGIPPYSLAQIWESKGRPEHSDVLSLAKVKQVVEEHGGQVWVESQLGKGSTFYVMLTKDTRSGTVAR